MNRRRTHTALFAHHPRKWQENRYVYPVISRRSKGLSVGINLNTDRICNFDCVYCCVDRSDGNLKPERVDVAQMAAELEAMLTLVASGEIWTQPPFDKTPQALRRLNDVAFSGNGEPTSAPEFGECCQIVANLLKSTHQEAARIVIITNATLLDRPKVQKALDFLDRHNGEIWAKLDAGNPDVYARLMKTSIAFQRVLDNILQTGQKRPIVIQSMFLRLEGKAPTEQEISDYVDRLRELAAGGCKIRLVQAYTVARPVFQTHVTPLEDEHLDRIAQSVRDAGLACEAYYAASAH